MTKHSKCGTWGTLTQTIGCMLQFTVESGWTSNARTWLAQGLCWGTLCLSCFNVSPASQTETGPPYSAFSMFEVASCSDRQYVSSQGQAWTAGIGGNEGAASMWWAGGAQASLLPVNHYGTAGVSTDPEHYRVLPSWPRSTVRLSWHVSVCIVKTVRAL